jgi:transposase
VEWRRARDAGALAELEPKVRRSKRSAEQAEIERLRRRNERLEDQLAEHRQALEIQGKASELLPGLLAEGTGETSQQRGR